MTQRNWLITGVSSGFGRELTTQLLERGDRVVGTIRRADAVADLAGQHPETFRAELLDVTDTAAVRAVVDRSFAGLGRIDVIVSNAGYGLFGAAEELTDEQVEHILDTNLLGSIALIIRHAVEGSLRRLRTADSRRTSERHPWHWRLKTSPRSTPRPQASRSGVTATRSRSSGLPTAEAGGL